MARTGRERYSTQIQGRVPPDLDVQAWPDARQGVVASQIGRQGEATPATLVGYPPWQAPPIGASSFYRSTYLTLGVGPVTQEIAGSIYQVGVNNVAIIRSLTLNVNNIVATSDITFTLLFNGGPVEGYDQIVIFPRVAASVSVSFTADDTYIHVPDAARISVRVAVGDAVAYQLGCDFKGWEYAKKYDGLGMLR